MSLTSQVFDVIISEPSNPWIAGIGDLFTREFFTVCRQRLTDQGNACIWLETYNIDIDSFKSVVNTFRSVFPAMTLWSTTEADVLMVGSKGQLNIDLKVPEERLNRDEISEDLVKIGIRSATDFLSHLIMGPDGSRRFADNAPIHTDDNALLEFSAPHILVRKA